MNANGMIIGQPIDIPMVNEKNEWMKCNFILKCRFIITLHNNGSRRFQGFSVGFLRRFSGFQWISGAVQGFKGLSSMFQERSKESQWVSKAFQEVSLEFLGVSENFRGVSVKFHWVSETFQGVLKCPRKFQGFMNVPGSPPLGGPWGIPGMFQWVLRVLLGL